MGKIARKKKGRPSKADLASRKLPEPPAESDLRRSHRRRNPTYHDDFYDEVEVDDEDERREKKLKLVLKLPHKAGFGGVDSSSSLTRTEVNAAHASGTESRAAAGSASSSEYGDGKKPFKKRKIGGDDGGYGDGEGDDDDDDDDDVGSIGSGDRKKERRGNSDSRGMVSAPGTPVDSPLGLPLPDKKSLELILDKLQKKDTYGVYAEPVDPEELPDYRDVIENPMDFGTLRRKLASGAYSNLEQFENDVFLICTNAMKYNAPETIYHKQARSIQELARKKFQRFRIDTERIETELKSEQKTKFSSIIKKPIKKPSCRAVQEPVGSDFSSGATLATTGDTCTWSNVTQAGGCERLNNVNGLVDGNSSQPDTKPEKTEEQFSWNLGKGVSSKFGRTTFVLDENRRATYNISNQPVVRMESIFSTFEGENKQLVSVGLHTDHSYARSLARFAATLGPVAWKVASQRIEQALPVGFKFGRGWVGEYEPLPTPVLMLENHTQKQPDYCTNLNRTAELRKDGKNAGGMKATQDDAKLGFRTLKSSGMTASNKNPDPAKVQPISGSTLEGKLFGVSGSKPIINATCQQQKSSTIANSDNNSFKQVELNCSSASGIASKKQFEYNSEITTSSLLDVVSRNRNHAQSVPFKPTETNGVPAGGLNNGKAMTSSLDGNRVRSLPSDFVSNQQARAATYVTRGRQEQGLSDPVQMMKMLAEKTQNQQKSSNHSTVDTSQVMPSVLSSSRDDSSAAARTRMSIGPVDSKLVGPPKMQIAAASLYNPARELPPPVMQICQEPPGSRDLQLLSEKNRFPWAFLPQPARAGDEARLQNNRPMVFPQLVATDLSRFQAQSPWRGLMPHTQQKQKQEMLPPDLNIGFQSSGSPVRQSSGILVDSQQPDLALQL